MKVALVALLLLAGCSFVPASTGVVAVRPLATYNLHWTGTGTVHQDDGKIDIGMDTRLQVVPLDHVFARSWLLKDGPSESRAMIFEGPRSWIERGGRREPMPDAMRLHELQQYGVYELILLSNSLGPQTVATGADRARVRMPMGGGEAELIFDKTGSLIELRNEVDDPEGRRIRVPQIFRFSGEVVDGDVRWPRRMEILQRGKLYFTMDIATFDAQRK